MTEVAFHLNVADIGGYTCRLLRKAYLKGARVRVLADAALIESLDRGLWLLGQGEFVPHATGDSAARVFRHSPIVLGDAPAEVSDVLVNLSPHMPVGAGAFARVIDIVGQGEVNRQQARQRWKLYRDAGLDPVAIDLAGAREG